MRGRIAPYGKALGEYFASCSQDQRKEFRTGARGNQGLTFTRRKCEKALHDKFPDFEPEGLFEALKQEAAQTKDQAFKLIETLELKLQEFIIKTLKLEYGDDDADPWWFNGVPVQIRTKASARLEEEQGKGKKEHYLDLIDFRAIALKNWPLFKDTLAIGKSGDKEKKTEWMHRLNEMRKAVFHPAKQQTIKFEQVAELRRYDDALTKNMSGEEASDERETE
jgi:DNA sulfur modification protein DndB